MAVDPRKKQKRHERKAAKRKSKARELMREKNAGLPERLRDATRCPVLDSWFSDDIWTQGIGYACLSRRLPNGSIAFAIFLVDRFCLGIKNVMVSIVNRSKYDEVTSDMRSDFTIHNVEPAAVRKLVEMAVDYASALGFPPHPDYQKGKLIFGDIDAAACTDTFEFGKDGKPFFVSGPYDNAARCQQVLSTLEHSCGPGGYDSVIPLVPNMGVLAGTEDEDFLEDEQEMDADDEKLLGPGSDREAN